MNVDVSEMRKKYIKDYGPIIDEARQEKVKSFKLSSYVARIVNKLEKSISKNSKYHINVKEINSKVDKANKYSSDVYKNFDLANKVNIDNKEQLLNCYIGKDVVNDFKFMNNVSIKEDPTIKKLGIDEEIREMKAFMKKYEGDSFYGAVMTMLCQIEGAVDREEYKSEGSGITALGRALRSFSGKGTTELLSNGGAVKDFNEFLDSKTLLEYRKRGDNSRGTYAQRYAADVNYKLAIFVNIFEMSKKMLPSIQKIYAPYLQEAEKMNLMLRSVDKKIKSHNSTDKGIKTRS